MLTRKKALSSLLISLLAIIIFYGHYLPKQPPHNLRFNYSTHIEMIQNELLQIKLCVIREVRQSRSTWSNLSQIINKCAAAHGAIERRFIEAAIDKHFIPYAKKVTHRECNVVSLGIGNEIVMEERLKEMQPFCKFYGADPFLDTAEVYKKVGEVFITAIDTATGEKVLSTLKDGSYSWNKVNVTSFGSFLKNDLRINKVHYLSMDVEGSEYRLLPYMTWTGAFSEESNSSIVCQIIAEIHGSLAKFNYTELTFQDFFLYFLSTSSFAPIRGSMPYDGHYIVFMNYEDEDCLKLFYS